MFAWMCTSASLKAGSNLRKKKTCVSSHLWLDPAGTQKMLLFARRTCCMLGQQWACAGDRSVTPLRLLLHRCHGLQHFLPFLHPSNPPLLHLFSSRSSPISSSEIEGKHRGGRWDRCRLKLASGWAGAQSSLIKYPHCVNFPLLFPEIYQFYL